MIATINGFIKRRPNLKNVFILSFFLFFSRGLGLVRQIIIYQKMDPISSDLLLASTKIPDTIVSLLLMGTVISSILPVTSRIHSKISHKEANKYINLMLITIISILGLVSLIGLIFTPYFLRLTTSPQTINNFVQAGVFNDYISTTRILLLGPILFGLQSIFGVFLNIKNRFLVYSWAGTIYNLGTILGLLFGQRNDYFSASTGMMLGALTTAVIFVIESKRAGYKFYKLTNLLPSIKSSYHTHKKDLWLTWKIFAPRVFLLNGLVISNLLINAVAQNNGQITAFDIGLSIQGVFFSVISSATIVAFPNLAKTFNQKSNSGEFWNKLRKYTTGILGLAFLGTIITIIFAPLVMRIFELFGRGQQTGNYIILIARITSIALIFQSGLEILSKYFFVRERVWQPIIISNSGLIIQVILLYFLVSNSFDSGIAVSISLVANFGFSFFVALYFLYIDYINKS